jgi:hypothetical protein
VERRGRLIWMWLFEQPGESLGGDEWVCQVRAGNRSAFLSALVLRAWEQVKAVNGSVC